MESSSFVVIKVKYEDIIRRFTTQIADGKLFINMAELRNKICTLYNFAPDADITMAYVDEDSDLVSLVNDDDLNDAVQQALNPLRIMVKLNYDWNGKKHNGATIFGKRRDVLSENLLDNVSEPLIGMLSNDLASNLSSLDGPSAPSSGNFPFNISPPIPAELSCSFPRHEAFGCPFSGIPHGRHQVGLHQHLHRGSKAKHRALNSRFIVDVNVFDGTVMPPSTPFTKIWRMRNNGMFPWPPKTQLVWTGGDKLSHADAVEVKIPSTGLPVDHELDVSVDFVSPSLPGRYVSYWRMASPCGQKFGHRVWVLIQVDASANESPMESSRNPNLNSLPPSNPDGSLHVVPKTGRTVREIPIFDGHSESDMPKKKMNFVEPLVHSKVNNINQELQSPINNSLLVGDGVSTSTPPSITPSAPYPVNDSNEVATQSFSLPQAPSTLVAPVTTPGKPDEELLKKNAMEAKLLKELDDMGFEHIDLNKEMNKDLNKKLLEKNSVNIQRVVLDVVAGKKA